MMGKRFGLPRKTQLQLAQGPQWWSHHSVQELNNQKATKLVRSYSPVPQVATVHNNPIKQLHTVALSLYLSRISQ